MKKKRKWIWIVAAVIVIALIGKALPERKKNQDAQIASMEEEAETAAPTEAETLTEPEIEAETSAPETVPETTSAPEPETLTEVSPEFKAFMDSYEAFFDEYVKFMNSFSQSADPAVLLQYSSYLLKYSEAMEKLNAICPDELSPADSVYYLQVMARIEEKLLGMAAGM